MPPNPDDHNPGKEGRTEKIGKSRSLDEPVEVSQFEGTVPEKRKSVSNLVDELLSEIYGKAELKRKQSVTTGGEWSWHESDQRNRSNPRFRSNLKQIEAKCWSKDVKMLKEEISALESLIADESNNLVKYLKRKDVLIARREAHYDVITAVIHAISRKTRDDMRMKFSLTPGTETGFSQWLDAMKMVAQLPGGVPSEFRTKLWLQLSERHLSEQNIDWEKAEAIIFNEWTNPDDEELGVQIVKFTPDVEFHHWRIIPPEMVDLGVYPGSITTFWRLFLRVVYVQPLEQLDLHRTGCSLFCGAQEQNQALLKRVLLAYARWNKNVGYCQGFNMLAALILQVMDRDEKNAVKVMIYLIEGVLPESYFANNLRGLSVDMAVFRDLLRLRLPKLSKHLEALQNDTNSGTSYEPPLTNVFTMQWFLTLFSNCLPQQTVLRVWDLVFLHGNEVLLRTALAIWGILQDRIMSVESADEFYSIMGVVTREMLEFGLMDANNLIKMIVMVDPFTNELQELREKYLYNISPWTQSVQSAARKGIKLFYSDPEDQDDTEDEDKIALATAYGVFRRRVSESGSRDVQPMGPTLDISVLKQQYAKLRQRQRQAHIIISAACSSSLPANLSSVPTVSVNHLLMGKSALVNKGRRIGPPEGSIPPPKNRTVKANEVGKQSGRKEKVVISGETLDWKDAEKRKCSKTESKKFSNTDGKLAINKSKTKSMESCNGLNREGGHFAEEEGGRKRRNSTSSASSTSTELCDDEFNRLSDFDAEESNPDRGNERRHPLKFRNQFVTDDPLSEAGRYEEVKECAAELVRDIEEAVNRSQRLTHLKNPVISDISNRKAEDEMTSNHDNITIKSPKFGDVEEEFLKTEPEVPIAGDVIDNAENRIFDRSKRESEPEESTLRKESETKSRRDRDRRKSDLALSVIKENLEMLSKFSQKSAVKEERNENGEEPGKKEVEAHGGKERDTERPELCAREDSSRLVTGKAEREVQVCKLREELKSSEAREVWGREDRPKGEKMFVKREEERTVSDIIREEKVQEETRSRSETVTVALEEDKPMRNVAADVQVKEDRTWRETTAVKWEVKSSKGIIGEVREEAEVEKRSMSEATVLKQEEERPLKNDKRKVEGMEGGWRSETLGAKREGRSKSDTMGEDEGRKDGRKWEITEMKLEENKSETDIQRREERHEVETRVKWEEKPNRVKEVQAEDRSRSETIIKPEEKTGNDVIREAQRDDPDKSDAIGVKRDEERLKRDVIREGENGPKREAAEMERGKSVSEKTDSFGDHFRKREEPGKLTGEKTVSRVNKEVNTDITIATDLEASPGRNFEGTTNNQGNVEEILMSLISVKSLQKSPERFKPEKRGYVEEKESETVRAFVRDDLAERWKKESERIESKIEMSKSDWELKMRRIAELENTTREKLNEIKSKSMVHRHRSLDRYDRREGEKRKSPIPRIQVPEDESENLEKRKKKISALSFDEITSRTEKLLGANLNLDSSGHRKIRKSFEEEGEGGGKRYEFYSSPTSPEYRGRKRSDYSSPKRYEGRWKIPQQGEEDWLTITEENGRGTRVDLSSPGRKSEKDQSPVGGFNPFPTRTQSRPKELGVRLGMYPPSPEGGHSSKKSH